MTDIEKILFNYPCQEIQTVKFGFPVRIQSKLSWNYERNTHNANLILYYSLNSKYRFYYSLNSKYPFYYSLNSKYSFCYSLNSKYPFYYSLNSKYLFYYCLYFKYPFFFPRIVNILAAGFQWVVYFKYVYPAVFRINVRHCSHTFIHIHIPYAYSYQTIYKYI